MKPRVVLDPNILVSGLLGGTATEVTKQWRVGAFTLIVSAEIMAEYEAVLRRPQFKLPGWVIEDYWGTSASMPSGLHPIGRSMR
jgi:hypothetical protein